MRRPPLAKLIVPAVLAVSSFAPACGGKDVTTTISTGVQTDTGAPTTTATPTTTGTSTGSSGSSGTTGGELPDCAQYNTDAETCSATLGCLYLGNEAVCIVRCDNFPDKDSCNLQTYCYWEDGCYLAV